jgi:hypothetical protein
MAMLVRKAVDTVEESTVYRCPEKRCKGTWPRPKEETWVEWYAIPSACIALIMNLFAQAQSAKKRS